MAPATSGFLEAPLEFPAHAETSSILGKALKRFVHSQEQTLLSSPVAQSLKLAVRSVKRYLRTAEE
jgi:hypothetical protein